VTVELVDVDDASGVRTLTLNSPHNRNALSAQLLGELAQGFLDATTDAGVRAIVLTGTGPVFCSGADLAERGSAAAPTRMPEILTAITNARVPVITRVNGHARAGGIGLIAASDIAVAAVSSTFAFSEVRVGVAPAMILVPSLRVADRRFLARMTLTGERFSAAEAARSGLLSDVVEDDGSLDGWVTREITAILKSAPGAVAATKALLGELPGLAFTEGLALASIRSAELFAGEEAAEGMDAFLNKRTPSWETTPS
jgi:methylglutaconyl-CoA hydratase